MIFEDCCTNRLSIKRGILSELSALPTCKSFRGADPKSPVAGTEEAENPAGREMLTRRRLPGNGLHPIEANQTKLRTQPEVAVGRLSNGADDPFGKAFADLPRRVRVLIDVQRRIQCEDRRTRQQDHPSQQKAWWEHESSQKLQCLHNAHVFLFPYQTRRREPDPSLLLTVSHQR